MTWIVFPVVVIAAIFGLGALAARRNRSVGPSPPQQGKIARDAIAQRARSGVNEPPQLLTEPTPDGRFFGGNTGTAHPVLGISPRGHLR
jgi:hypothetical protein